MQTLSLEISGMSCGHCVGAVKTALEGVPGVAVEQVRIGSATVQVDSTAVTVDRISAAIADAGFAVSSVS